jgi:hypothetical protein
LTTLPTTIRSFSWHPQPKPPESAGNMLHVVLGTMSRYKPLQQSIDLNKCVRWSFEGVALESLYGLCCHKVAAVNVSHHYLVPSLFVMGFMSLLTVSYLQCILLRLQITIIMRVDVAWTQCILGSVSSCQSKLLRSTRDL